MPENHRDDFERATAAEQSAEVDEEQTGNTDAAAGKSEEAAEHEAMHVIDDDEEEGDLAGLLEALDAAIDPEADSIVDDALDIDSVDEADASVAATDDEADIDAEEEAAEEADVTPYDGPDPGAELDAADADAADIDPYDEFKSELREKPGKWYVIHSYAGFEKRVKQNIDNRKISMAMEEYVFEVRSVARHAHEIHHHARALEPDADSREQQNLFIGHGDYLPGLNRFRVLGGVEALQEGVALEQAGQVFHAPSPFRWRDARPCRRSREWRRPLR